MRYILKATISLFEGAAFCLELLHAAGTLRVPSGALPSMLSSWKRPFWLLHLLRKPQKQFEILWQVHFSLSAGGQGALKNKYFAQIFMKPSQ